MEIKVQCDCGQKFKFDVEPVGGRMPWEVNCPVCGASGTEKANQIIQQQPAAPVTVPVARIISTSPTEAASAAAPTEAPKARLSISRPQPEAAPMAPRMTAPAAARPVTRAVGGVPRPVKKPAVEQNFLMGCVGAVVGGLVGMAIWYGITVATDREFGLIAWGLGGLVGFGARVLGKEGSVGLGVVAGLCAAVSILGGGVLATSHAVGKYMTEMAHEVYVAQVQEAKEAGSLQSDADIRKYLAKREFVENPAEITAEDIAVFKTDELPELQALADGGMSEAAYQAKFKKDTRAIGLIASVIGSFSLWTLLWLFFGVGTAFKLGYASES